MSQGLNPEQIQQFHEDGFLIVRDLLPREALQPLIDELRTANIPVQAFIPGKNTDKHSRVHICSSIFIKNFLSSLTPKFSIPIKFC